MDTELSDIKAYILIGGQSRRLQIDKSLVQLNKKSLTEIAHQNLSLLFKNIYIVGKVDHFREYNFIPDIKPVQCPLNGIVTALEHSQINWIFVIACDLPLVKTNIINYLYKRIDEDNQAVIPLVNNRLQPLCAFYHKSVLKVFNNALAEGNYSLMKLLDEIKVVKHTIPSAYEDQFLNINYPEDLNKAEKSLAR